MLTLILKSLYLMLPAYFANMAPIICKKIKFLNVPVDFNEKLEGKPIFGRNKTYRGLLAGVIFAVIIAFIQFLLSRFNFFSSISILDYSEWHIIGFLLGLGALVGDMAESFIKRRLNIKPGKSFIPFDQTDYAIGALIFISILNRLELNFIFITIALSFMLHIIVNHLSFLFKIRKSRW
ncbi:MAG: CDP-2,3-bis-(O-geranylgeranyl)-sn-glycerol synthase [Candidatus Woesearchaeota archaeon]|nr:CDP-2,3-bis-(O-geranylgeranyl)-sn-glycerol synthase [Candidatus Woesearchaeota archaeon]